MRTSINLHRRNQENRRGRGAEEKGEINRRGRGAEEEERSTEEEEEQKKKRRKRRVAGFIERENNAVRWICKDNLPPAPSASCSRP